MIPWIFSNSCSLNLLLDRNYQAEIIIVKRLIQGRNNVTRVRIKPRSYDQDRRKKDEFALSSILPTNSKHASKQYSLLANSFLILRRKINWRCCQMQNLNKILTFYFNLLEIYFTCGTLHKIKIKFKLDILLVHVSLKLLQILNQKTP